jgi:hypothetical protein
VTRKSGLSVLVTVLVGLITIALLCSAQAQTGGSFTRADRFTLPNNNATVTFGTNGTYAQVSQENNAWVFTNMRLGFSGILPSFSVSAQNCNMTITRLTRTIPNPNSNAAFFSLVSVRYTVSSAGGMQTFKFGVNLTGGLWMVAFNGTSYPSQGDGWNVSPDGTLTVTGATLNVTASYNLVNPRVDDSNLPFYEQHKVAIATGIAVAVSLVLGAVFMLRNKVREGKQSLAMPSDKVLRHSKTTEMG